MSLDRPTDWWSSVVATWTSPDGSSAAASRCSHRWPGRRTPTCRRTAAHTPTRGCWSTSRSASTAPTTRAGCSTGCGTPAGSSNANAVLVGRTPAEDKPDLTQLEAVEDALGDLGIPVVAEMDIGHTQPFLPLVNGASARVVVRDGVREVTQTLG